MLGAGDALSRGLGLFILDGIYAALLLGFVAAGVILAMSMPDLARMALDLPFSPPAEVQTAPPSATDRAGD